MTINQLILQPGQVLQISGGTTIHATVHYADHAASGQLTPGNQLTITDGAGAIDICAAPSTGKQRIIKSVTITNKSGGNFTDLSLIIKEGSTSYTVEMFDLNNKVSETF